MVGKATRIGREKKVEEWGVTDAILAPSSTTGFFSLTADLRREIPRKEPAGLQEAASSLRFFSFFFFHFFSFARLVS